MTRSLHSPARLEKEETIGPIRKARCCDTTGGDLGRRTGRGRFHGWKSPPCSAVWGPDGILGSKKQVEIRWRPSQRQFGDSFTHEHLIGSTSLCLIGVRDGDIPATALAVLHLESEN